MCRRALVPLLVAVAFACLFLGPSLVGDGNVYWGDLTFFEHPRDRLLHASLWSGHGLPRWAPGIFGGVSTVAAQEMALFYAPNTLAAALFPDKARAIGLFLHLILASLGAYALARELGLSPRAALLAAIVYGSGGALLSTHGVPVYVRSAGWLPWILTGIARRSVALSTLGFLATYLGGDPFGCVVAALASLAVSPSLALVKSAALSACLGAIQLLPALGTLADSVRKEGYSFEGATVWSLWPPELAGLVVPFLFGSHASAESVWVDAVSPRHAPTWFETVYVGPIALSLAVAGALRGQGAARRTGLLLLPFVLLALGSYTPLGHLVHALAASFRYPAKLFLPATLGLALLAGSGLDALPRRGLVLGLSVLGLLLLLASNLVTAGAFEIDTSEAAYVDGPKALAALAPRIAHAAFFALGAAAILARGRRKRLALLVLVGLDLGLALRPAVLVAPARLYDPVPPAARVLGRLGEELVPARAIATPLAERPTVEEFAAITSAGGDPGDFTGGLRPNVGTGDGVLLQDGFLSNEPLRPSVMETQTERLLFEKKISPERSYALLGARFVLAMPGELHDVTPIERVGERVLVRLRDAPPWAAVYPRVHTVSGIQGALDALRGAAKEPVIEGEPLVAPGEGEVREARLASRFGDDRFELEARGPGWLVVREAFATGWKATVDGVSAPIFPADVLFRAVPLSAGTKKVVFEYAPSGTLSGALLSALTLAACGAYAWRRRRP